MSSIDEAVRLVREAVDAGITFFDNCWEYSNGKTESWLGEALHGRRLIGAAPAPPPDTER